MTRYFEAEQGGMISADQPSPILIKAGKSYGTGTLARYLLRPDTRGHPWSVYGVMGFNML